MRLVFSLVLVAVLAGCSGEYSPNTYSPGAVQQAAKVDQGVIVGVRLVDVTTSGTVGAATGAAAGGIIGSQSPGGGMGAAIGAVGGSLVGGLIGTTAEHVATDTTAFEYVVRKKTGELVSVTQKDEKPLQIGQAVLVIAGPQARVVADYTIPPPAHPAPPPAVAASPAAPEVPPVPDPAPVPPPVATAPVLTSPVIASPATSVPTTTAAQAPQPGG